MVVKVLCRWFFEGKEATWVNQVENHPNCCNHLNLKQNNNQCCSQASVYGRSQLRLESAAAADSGLALFLIVLVILAHCRYSSSSFPHYSPVQYLYLILTQQSDCS